MEYLFFRIGGYFDGQRVLNVRNQDSCLVLDYFQRLREDEGDSSPNRYAVWTKDVSKRWLIHFNELRVEDWEDYYYDNIMDGTQWELRLKYEGQSERCISGSNAYPKNWGEFKELIDTSVNRLPRVEDITIEEILDKFYRAEMGGRIP